MLRVVKVVRPLAALEALAQALALVLALADEETGYQEEGPQF